MTKKGVSADNRIMWMDVMRGLAIIGVVVCHQQGLLHQSEIVQFLTLFSVPSLIFMMGITKSMSLKRYAKEYVQGNGRELISAYTLRSMRSTLCSYVIAAIVADICLLHVNDSRSIILDLFGFDVQKTFYYIMHYIRLSLWAPVIFFVLTRISRAKGFRRTALYICAILFTWVIGYVSVGRLDIFSQSYLSIYTMGMIISFTGIPKPTKFTLIGTAVMLAAGTYLAHRFYFARVGGNWQYAELIDIIDPKLQLNPPNLSVIIYTAGIVALVYHFVVLLEGLGSVSKILSIPAVLGRYSLDIFLWHLFIQQILKDKLLSYLENIWVSRVVFYSAMLGIPVVCRWLYTNVKQLIYTEITEVDNED